MGCPTSMDLGGLILGCPTNMGGGFGVPHKYGFGGWFWGAPQVWIWGLILGCPTSMDLGGWFWGAPQMWGGWFWGAPQVFGVPHKYGFGSGFGVPHKCLGCPTSVDLGADFGVGRRRFALPHGAPHRPALGRGAVGKAAVVGLEGSGGSCQPQPWVLRPTGFWVSTRRRRAGPPAAPHLGQAPRPLPARPQVQGEPALGSALGSAGGRLWGHLGGSSGDLGLNQGIWGQIRGFGVILGSTQGSTQGI